MQAIHSSSHILDTLGSGAHVVQGAAPSTTVKVEVKDTWHPVYKSLVCQAVRYLALNYTEENGQIQSFEVDKNLRASIGVFQKENPLKLQEGLFFTGEGHVSYGAWQSPRRIQGSFHTEGCGQMTWDDLYQMGLFRERIDDSGELFISLKEGIMFDQDGSEFAGTRDFYPMLTIPDFRLGAFSDPSGKVEDGNWRVEPQARAVKMFDGKVTHPDGMVEEGPRIFEPNVSEMVLQQGKRTHPNGKVEEGSWAYVKELGEMRLHFGQVTHANGVTENGVFQYEPEMHNMALKQGETNFLGLKHTGRFALEPESEVNKPFLQLGTKTEFGGAQQEGTWAYIPELQRMHLVDGVVKNKQGKVLLDGAWAYNPSGKGGMVHTPRPAGAEPRKPLPKPVQWQPKPPMAHKGWVPSPEFTAAFNTGWLSIKNARLKEEWTLKVIKGSCPKRAGGKAAKQDWRNFDGPVRDIGRSEAQLEIARNLLKEQPNWSLGKIASLTALPLWQVYVVRAELAAPCVADIEFEPPRATIEVQPADFS